MTHLSETEKALLVMALQERATEMKKVSEELATKFAQFQALTPDQKAEYDKPAEVVTHADGSKTIDCAPHPRSYEHMAKLFGDMASDASALMRKVDLAEEVALIAESPCQVCENGKPCKECKELRAAK